MVSKGTGGAGDPLPTIANGGDCQNGGLSCISAAWDGLSAARSAGGSYERNRTVHRASGRRVDHACCRAMDSTFIHLSTAAAWSHHRWIVDSSRPESQLRRDPTYLFASSLIRSGFCPQLANVVVGTGWCSNPSLTRCPAGDSRLRFDRALGTRSQLDNRAAVRSDGRRN